MRLIRPLVLSILAHAQAAAAACPLTSAAPGTGDAALRISEYQFAQSADGFDLDGDGTNDNQLAAFAPLANDNLKSQFSAGQLRYALELFGLGTPATDACVTGAVYRGEAMSPPGGFLIDASVAATTFSGGAVSGSPGLLTFPEGTFSLVVPLDATTSFEAPFTRTQLRGTLVPVMDGFTVDDGLMGGIFAASSLEATSAPNLASLGIDPSHTLLDLFFASPLSTVLGLSKDANGCVFADVDVDNDGLESFCDTNPGDNDNRVDRCVDGNGNSYAPSPRCSDLKDGAGNQLFRDGISGALSWRAAPVNLLVPCSNDDACPSGRYCSSTSVCASDCSAMLACSGGETCSDRGRCEAPINTPGCGCSVASRNSPLSRGTITFGAVALLLLIRTRAARRSSRSRASR